MEIGAGPGTLTIPLAEKVKMVTAMEISAKAALNMPSSVTDPNWPDM
ncbi:MAG: hypothetical protein KAU38_03135 [Desulfobacterales bacterium]|nr:hypothetical protein [Desulfobacterales bacterium]